MSDPSDRLVRITVCVMCNDRRRGGMWAGKSLRDELAAAARQIEVVGVEVVGVECMSVCRPAITLSFAADGKWTHVFAVPSTTDPAEILAGARLYAASRTGLFPWSRCEALREGVVARIPPPPSRDAG